MADSTARRRGRGIGLGAAALVMSLVLAIAGGASATIYVLASGPSSIVAPFLPAQPGSVAWNRHDPLTVLLLGADGESTSTATTSSIMIASFAPTTHRLTMLSIPGNLWVTVPGFGQTELSQAYADGGVRLALLAVQGIIRTVIPYYLVTDSQATVRAINDLGDLNLRVSAAQASAMTKIAPRSGVTPGASRLDASGVLAYVSPFGQPVSGTLDQMAREQTILVAALRQDLAPDVSFQLPELIDGLGGSIQTNFPLNEVPELARELNTIPPAHILLSSVGPSNSTATPYISAGASVFLPDVEAVSRLAQRLFPDPGLHSEGSVTVLNGSGTVGAAASLATCLRDDGINVRTVASASSFNNPTTQVQLASGANVATRSLARTLASLLQAPIATHGLARGKTPIVVLIGKDYQDLTQH